MANDELIRKQDALDALMAERKHLLANGQKGAEHVLTHHGYNVIDELQPVQSDVPDINDGELISKRAATTIPVMPKEHRHYQTTNLDDAYEQGWNDLQECIENLPTVQPKQEIKATLSKTETVGDTISRNAAIDAVLDRMNIEKYGRNAKPEEIMWTLENLPPVQPKHGKWKPRYYDVGADTYVEWACSECGYVRQKGREDGDAGEEPEADFCEKCGVKMER